MTMPHRVIIGQRSPQLYNLHHQTSGLLYRANYLVRFLLLGHIYTSIYYRPRTMSNSAKGTLHFNNPYHVITCAIIESEHRTLHITGQLFTEVPSLNFLKFPVEYRFENIKDFSGEFTGTVGPSTLNIQFSGPPNTASISAAIDPPLEGTLEISGRLGRKRN
jgi:hypothetical protein